MKKKLFVIAASVLVFGAGFSLTHSPKQDNAELPPYYAPQSLSATL
ncbi:hypothetical protein [Falsibacillus albus]|nr:hypothetical protein [Falsibacillus albus]